LGPAWTGKSALTASPMCKSAIPLRLADMERYLAATLLLLSCARSDGKTEVRQSPSGSVADSILLERTACYGTCPAYRLRLSDAGEIRFESRNPGEAGRSGVDTMAPRTLPLLIAKAMAAGFYEMPPDISQDSTLCRDRATDHPTVVVTVFRRGDTKAVTDYQGCFETTEHEVLPRIARLRSFENEIDSVLKSSRWVRPARGR
jgi:hypothetical protein